MKKIIIITAFFCLFSLGNFAQKKYEPTWASLDSRPVPEWFRDARLGIFIHWGVYSVPSWAPKGEYSEWYWAQLRNDKPDGPWKTFHNRVYGKDYPYELFAPHFTAELFEPDKWADLFRQSGAKYVVLTSKHHDGFALWPAPGCKDWNSVEIGAKRDLLGELTNSVRNKGLRMGYYYSLHNWFDKDYAPADPEGPRNITKYVDEIMMPQMKDLVNKYKPSLIFTDGEWTAPSDDFKSKDFLTWLYNESEAPSDVIVNDRWGTETRGYHGGYLTSEYGLVDLKGTPLNEERVWEECRGIGASFGYNRNESVEDYFTRKQVIHLLIDIVSRGGNLLLNVGPTADGRIPPIMEDRLQALGSWLDVNGEAIYDTRKWTTTGEGPTPREKGIAQSKSSKEAVEYTGKDIRYTVSKDGRSLYAIVLGWPQDKIELKSLNLKGGKGTVSLLGSGKNVPYRTGNQGKLTIDVSGLTVKDLPCEHAFVFKLTGFTF